VNFEAFTAVIFQVEIFWFVTPCTVEIGYQLFGGPCCLYLQSEKSIGSKKRWCPPKSLHVVITQKGQLLDFLCLWHSWLQHSILATWNLWSIKMALPDINWW